MANVFILLILIATALAVISTYTRQNKDFTTNIQTSTPKLNSTVSRDFLDRLIDIAGEGYLVMPDFNLDRVLRKSFKLRRGSILDNASNAAENYAIVSRKTLRPVCIIRVETYTLDGGVQTEQTRQLLMSIEVPLIVLTSPEQINNSTTQAAIKKTIS